MPEWNPHETGTASLAYLGDCVMELLVRETLVRHGLSTSKGLNAAALSFVRAEEQAAAYRRIEADLTEEENAVFRRGRNVGHTHVPKHASMSDYRTATGLESLFGYLYLAGQEERARALFGQAYAEQIALLPTP